MHRRGLLVVLSGPAGSGKSTLADAVIDGSAGEVVRSVTATTRSPREGEVDGRDYVFLTRESFKQGLADGRFVEYTEFNGNLYGTLRENLTTLLAQDKVVMLVIDVEGSAQIRQTFPNAIHVFVLPPTREALRARLSGRGTECPDDIEERLSIAEKEVGRLESYDYLVVNDEVASAAADLLSIIRLARIHHIRGGECDAWKAGGYADWHMRLRGHG